MAWYFSKLNKKLIFLLHFQFQINGQYSFDKELRPKYCSNDGANKFLTEQTLVGLFILLAHVTRFAIIVTFACQLRFLAMSGGYKGTPRKVCQYGLLQRFVYLFIQSQENRKQLFQSYSIFFFKCVSQPKLKSVNKILHPSTIVLYPIINKDQNYDDYKFGLCHMPYILISLLNQIVIYLEHSLFSIDDIFANLILANEQNTNVFAISVSIIAFS